MAGNDPITRAMTLLVLAAVLAGCGALTGCTGSAQEPQTPSGDGASEASEPSAVSAYPSRPVSTQTPAAPAPAATPSGSLEKLRALLAEEGDESTLTQLEKGPVPEVLLSMLEALARDPGEDPLSVRANLTIRAIGELGIEEAVDPLIRLRFLPNPPPGLEVTCYHALYQIGPAAGRVATAMLKGERPDLLADYNRVIAAFGAEERKHSVRAQRWQPTPYFVHAAEILGGVGEGDPALLTSGYSKLSRLSDKFRTIQALSLLPHTEATRSLFRALTEKTLSSVVREGTGYVYPLTSSIEAFFDESYVPLLVDASKKTQNASATLSLLKTAIVLMGPEQSPMVQRAIKVHPGSPPNSYDLEHTFAAAQELLTRCGVDKSCYFEAVVQRPSNNYFEVQPRQAIFRLGILGLVSSSEDLASLSTNARRGELTEVGNLLLHLSPHGELPDPPELLKRYEAVIASNGSAPRMFHALRTRRAKSR